MDHIKARNWAEAMDRFQYHGKSQLMGDYFDYIFIEAYDPDSNFREIEVDNSACRALATNAWVQSTKSEHD